MRLASSRTVSLSRSAALVAAASFVPVAAASAAPEGAAGPVNLLEPNAGLMVWTTVVFIGLLVVLKKFAFGPLFAAVEAREQALADAIDGAKRDREAAAALLAEQKAALDGSRAQAQQLIAEGRAVAEKMRADLLDETRRQQAEMLEQARRDIEGEKASAIADLRREAVDLAIIGAGKVIEQNLDSAGNRRIVEQFLASLPAVAGPRA
jgi:F-type H+-transporting ATPase subunit b